MQRCIALPSEIHYSLKLSGLSKCSPPNKQDLKGGILTYKSAAHAADLADG